MADEQQASSAPVVPYRPGEELPAVCGVQQVARVLDVSVSRVHQLHRLGYLRRFELESLGDKRTRYCGRKLQAWANGDAADYFINGNLDRPRTFGRKRA